MIILFLSTTPVQQAVPPAPVQPPIVTAPAKQQAQQGVPTQPTAAQVQPPATAPVQTPTPAQQPAAQVQPPTPTQQPAAQVQPPTPAQPTAAQAQPTAAPVQPPTTAQQSAAQVQPPAAQAQPAAPAQQPAAQVQPTAPTAATTMPVSPVAPPLPKAAIALMQPPPGQPALNEDQIFLNNVITLINTSQITHRTYPTPLGSNETYTQYAKSLANQPDKIAASLLNEKPSTIEQLKMPTNANFLKGFKQEATTLSNENNLNQRDRILRNDPSMILPNPFNSDFRSYPNIMYVLGRA